MRAEHAKTVSQDVQEIVQMDALIQSMKTSIIKVSFRSSSVVLSLLWMAYAAVETGISHDLANTTRFFFMGIAPLMGLGMIIWVVDGFMDNFYDE